MIRHKLKKTVDIQVPLLKLLQSLQSSVSAVIRSGFLWTEYRIENLTPTYAIALYVHPQF